MQISKSNKASFNFMNGCNANPWKQLDERADYLEQHKAILPWPRLEQPGTGEAGLLPANRRRAWPEPEQRSKAFLWQTLHSSYTHHCVHWLLAEAVQ